MSFKSTFVRSYFAICLAVAAFSARHPAWSWDTTGHMLVAQIAYDTMPQDVALRIQKKLKPLPRGFGPYNFVTAAAWMDDIKRNRPNSWNYLTPLHYIDIPYSPRGATFKIPPGKNALTQLEKTIQDIQKGTDDPDLQARQWAIVMHLVGDIHQPLHCADHDDRGGNEVNIRKISKVDDIYPPRNLHALWDEAYRFGVVDGKMQGLFHPIGTDDRPKQITRGAIATQAQNLLNEFPPQKIAGYNDNRPLDWIKESYQVACKVAYAPAIARKDKTQSLVMTPDYVRTAHDIAAQRIVLAGVRLGRLLQQLDDPNGTVITEIPPQKTTKTTSASKKSPKKSSTKSKSTQPDLVDYIAQIIYELINLFKSILGSK